MEPNFLHEPVIYLSVVDIVIHVLNTFPET